MERADPTGPTLCTHRNSGDPLDHAGSDLLQSRAEGRLDGREPVSEKISTRKSTPRKQISSAQIVFGSMLAISLLLAINFSGRIAAGRRIESERVDLNQNIQTLQARATALRIELDFTSSDDYVREWARREGRMVQPNEVLVVPVPAYGTPAPTPTPFTPPADVRASDTPQNWELWWQLFFDSPPPNR